MNDLNAQQIVLLCLLVSFVSSIATGITTVSLLEQSPEPVSQTINRVVEKTIERVVEPAANQNEKPVERIVETVVVNQEDLTVEAVAKNSKSLVRLYEKDGFGKLTFIGLGVVVSDNGRVLTQSSVIGSKVVGSFESGDFDLKLVKTESPFNLYEVSDPGTSSFNAASLGDSQSLKLAQTVILLSGRQNNVVSTGIINDIAVLGGDTENKDVVTSIDAGVDINKILIGSMLLNLQGEIVGLKMGSGSSETSAFLPVNRAKTFVSGAAN